jgi:hypothetical protein
MLCSFGLSFGFAVQFSPQELPPQQPPVSHDGPDEKSALGLLPPPIETFGAESNRVCFRDSQEGQMTSSSISLTL